MNFSRTNNLYRTGMKPYIYTKKELKWRQSNHVCSFTTDFGKAKLSF